MYRFSIAVTAGILVATAAAAAPPTAVADPSQAAEGSGGAMVAFSTSNRKPKTPYAYTNPYGVGPNNDSR